MSIEVSPGNFNDTIVITIDGPESVTAFKELVFRATNLWPDAPVEIKEFADVVIHGTITQNYRLQEAYRNNPMRHVHWHRCPTCDQQTAVTTNSKEPPSYSIKCERNVIIHVDQADPKNATIAKCNVLAPFTPANKV